MVTDRVGPGAVKIASHFPPNSIVFADKHGKEVMRITDSGITVGKDVNVDEAAQAVISALDVYIRQVQQRRDAEISKLLNLLADARAESMKLRAALHDVLGWHDYSNNMHKPIEVRAAYMRARAALEGK